MSGNQNILEKLQLKEEKNILIQGLPSSVEKQFAKLSYNKNLTPLLKTRKIDFALIFAINQLQLNNILRYFQPFTLRVNYGSPILKQLLKLYLI